MLTFKVKLSKSGLQLKDFVETVFFLKRAACPLKAVTDDFEERLEH